VEEQQFNPQDMMDPYRLGELRLNNHSEYNDNLLKAQGIQVAKKEL